MFRNKEGLRNYEIWTYKDMPLEVINDFNYIGTVFICIKSNKTIWKRIKSIDITSKSTVLNQRLYVTYLTHLSVQF